MTELFSDNFEDGTFDAWSGTGGDVSVTEASALHGDYGMSVLIDDNNAKYAYYQVSAQSRVRSRFYFDPNGLTMRDGDYFRIYSNQCSSGTNPYAYYIFLYRNDSNYKIFARVIKDDDSWTDTASEYTVTDAPHCIEVDWKASSGAGNNDGYLSLWIDGTLKNTISDVDNDTKSPIYLILGIEDFAAGASGTSGTFYLDDFASNDDGTEIGEISEGIPFNGATISKWNDTEISKLNGA